MPRFGSSSFLSPTQPGLGGSENMTPSFTPNPSRTTTPSRNGGGKKDSSVSLSCLSPDGKFIHSFARNSDGSVCIESHSLPLENELENIPYESDLPAVIVTKLPEVVQFTLENDSPIELICVDGDTSSSSSSSFKNTAHDTLRQRVHLPLLCLYSRRSAFLLHLAYRKPRENSNTYRGEQPMEGEVISVDEPFESHLTGCSMSNHIIRIRPAPQRREGYATMCPPGSMAMLTNEYAIALYHGPPSRTRNENNQLDIGNGMVTVPLSFRMEELAYADDAEGKVTDFCFAQSNNNDLSLMTSMSILLLKGSGEVSGASPVMFNGAVVPRLTVEKSLRFVAGEIQRLDSQENAKWRQYKAAQVWLEEVFHDKSGESHYITAKVQSTYNTESISTWPLQLQGPAVSADAFDSSPDEVYRSAFGLEPFFADSLVGFAIGRDGPQVDFCALPPTAIMPRFEYEGEDRGELDTALGEMGVVVERVLVEMEDDDGTTLRGRTSHGKSSLVKDPVVDTMIHVVSTNGVSTVNTNAMTVISNKVALGASSAATNIQGFMSPIGRGSKRSKESVRTTAWACLEVASVGGISLMGTGIGSDAHMGHVLLTRLSNGKMDAVNMTESRYLHEANSLFESKTEESQQLKCSESTAADEALQAMEATPALHTLVFPLMQKVTTGISGMGKIVGASTPVKDIDPSTLAMAIATKEKCDKEVVLPLQKLKSVTAARLEEMKDMHKSQLVQIENLKEMMRVLKERAKVNEQNMNIAESNAAEMAQQSSAILNASNMLLPTLTKAEREFFSEVTDLEAKCRAWENSIKKLREKSQILCDSMDAGQQVCTVNLEPQIADSLYSVLNGVDSLKKEAKISLDNARLDLEEVNDSRGGSNENKAYNR